VRCDGCCEVWQGHLNRLVDAVISKNAKKKPKTLQNESHLPWEVTRGAFG